MKILVIDKYTIITAVLIAALITVSYPLTKNAVEVYNTQKELPIYSVERSDRKVSVTFDCAWGAEDVDAIIAALDEHNCKATFFVLGTWAEKYPDVIKKLHDAGHEIANHSYNHAYYTQLTPEEMTVDMDKCDEAIKKITGTAPKLFRAPAGDYNNSVISTVHNSGRFCIQWDADSLDYKDLTPAQMEERIMSKVGVGSIILFHTGTKNTAAALSPILTRLENEGYQFCPAGELIYRESYTIDHTGRQFPMQ
ncbi:MAG: polysaccharide deacetylase family protein [Clostridia bacterium]